MGFLIKCPICGGDFKDGRPYTGTSGVAFAPPSPLYEYCDAGLHFECLEKWGSRKEFSEGYYQLHVENFQSMGTLLFQGEDWVLGCGPAPLDKEPYYAEVDLKEWPCRLKTNWQDWNNFINGDYKNDLYGEALIKSEEIIENVKSIAPDLQTLINLRKNVRSENA